MLVIETAFARLDSGTIRTMGAADDRRAQIVTTIIEDSSLLLFTTTLLKSISALAIVGISIHLFKIDTSLSGTMSIVVAVWFLLVILHLLLPLWATTYATSLAIQSAPAVRILVFCYQPMAKLLLKANKSMSTSTNETDILLPNDERLSLLLDANQYDADIPENERQMIESILDLEGTTVREVMVPRIDMVTLDARTSLQEALDTILDVGHSRIPVYEENVDHIIGILYAKDLLHCLRDQRTDVDIREQLRPVSFVPNSKKLTDFFPEMQKRRVHIAMVVDEYGGTAGLVTIEDLLEEIVGEIQDEYDPDEELLVEFVGNEAYIFSARLHIDDLAELLGLSIEAENADTLGGLIFRLAGHVPTQSELVEYDGWQFTVLSLDGNRIERIRAEPVSAGNNSTSAELPEEDSVFGSPNNQGRSTFNLSTLDQTQ